MSIAPATRPDQTPGSRPILGSPEAPILVLCDPQNEDALRYFKPMGAKAYQTFVSAAKQAGLPEGVFQFVGLCRPIPEDAKSSAKKTWTFVQPFLEGLPELLEARAPKIVVPLGNLALRAIVGKATGITKARGVVAEHHGRPTLPMLPPSMVLRTPEHRPIFEADFGVLKRFMDSGFDMSAPLSDTESRYEWRDDLSDLLEARPRFLAVDTETTGLHWYQQGTRVLTVQLCTEPGRALVVPIDPEYRRRHGLFSPSMRSIAKVKTQLRHLLEDPTIPKVGHNIKYDHHMLRKADINVKGWVHDTQLLAFAADENMINKGLDDCVRRWVPAMASYADVFNATVNKADMLSVPPNDVLDESGHVVQRGMLNYAAGDPDATFRLAQALVPEVRKDPAQYACYRRVMLPGILAFAEVVEPVGQVIDRDYLRALERDIRQWTGEEYDRLIRMVPPAVRQKHLAAKGEAGLRFSRDDFMRDVLFSRDGFKLKARVWTKTTTHLPPDERVASVSTKDHMPYFLDAAGQAGEFVRGYVAYQKAQKLLTTYIGEEAKGTGFWKYISDEGRIHPSYMLHRTNTGRTASADPNGQNIPKRGDFAKTYRKSFRATPGFRRVDVDLSQIELRLVAWMANEPEMLRIYGEDGDIHTETAMATMRLTAEDWANLDAGTKKKKRTSAKAVNFGFIYGMQWRGFKTYAKTSYGVDYSDEEAQQSRTLFFRKYAGLLGWHDRMKEFARTRGHVRALHGALRRLPSIWSDDESMVALAERQAVNAPIQRFGSDLGVIAMSILGRHTDPDILRPVGFIHDCLACEAREGYEDEAARAVVWIMENLPLTRYFGITPPIPIRADPEVENEAGEMIERQDLSARVPWFWKDEVEREFETWMGATGCNAHVPFEPLADQVPVDLFT